MREPNLGALQLPELCDLIQKVELNTSKSLRKKKGTTLETKDELLSLAILPIIVSSTSRILL